LDSETAGLRFRKRPFINQQQSRKKMKRRRGKRGRRRGGMRARVATVASGHQGIDIPRSLSKPF